MNGVAGRTSIGSKPADAQRRAQPGGGEVGAVAGQLEREPVFAERPSLPRAPVRDDHGQTARRAAAPREPRAGRARVDHMLERVAEDDRVELGARAAGVGRAVPTWISTPRARATSAACGGGLDAKHAPAGLDPAGGEIAAPAADIQQRPGAAAPGQRGRAGSVRLRPRCSACMTWASGPAGSSYGRVVGGVERAELGLGTERQRGARAARRADVDRPVAGDPGHPVARDERRRAASGPSQARQARQVSHVAGRAVAHEKSGSARHARRRSRRSAS